MKKQKIAIFRALQLGDLLCAIPAIRSLKGANPAAEIILLGLPWAESFVERFSAYFSRFIHFPGFPGLIEQLYDFHTFIDFLTRMHKEQVDLLIQMHGNGSVINPLMAALGAKDVAGYVEPGAYCSNEKMFMTYPEGISEVRRHLKLMEFLNIPTLGEDLEFPITKAEQESFRQLCKDAGIRPGNYVCVHTGARDGKRRWDSEKFAKIADAMAAKGYTILFTGTTPERNIAEQAIQQMQSQALNYAGNTSLGTLAMLIKNARMLLSNDTGVSHIAAAVKTRSVILFLTSDPNRWAPSNRELHRVILPNHLDDLDYVGNHVEQLLDNRLETEEAVGAPIHYINNRKENHASKS